MSIPQARLAGLIPDAPKADLSFDPTHSVFAVSSSACFCPEDDDPENFDGRMTTWTFAVPKGELCGAGFYRIEFVRILTPEERGNTTKQLIALAAIADTHAKRGDDFSAPSPMSGGGAQSAIAQTPPGSDQ